MESREAGWDRRETVDLPAPVAKPRMSHSPQLPTQRAPYPIPSETDQHGAAGESEQMLLKLLLTLTETEAEGVIEYL